MNTNGGPNDRLKFPFTNLRPGWCVIGERPSLNDNSRRSVPLSLFGFT